MGNRTAAVTGEDSSHNVNPNQANVANEALPNPTDNNPQHVGEAEKATPMTLKVKLIIAVTVILMAAGLAVGIYFIVDHFSPKMTISKSTSMVFNEDNSVLKVWEVDYLKYKAVGKNQNIKMLVSAASAKASGRMLQGNDDLDVTIKEHATGLLSRIRVGGQCSFYLRAQTFFGAIEQEQNSARRLQTVSDINSTSLQAEYADIESNVFSGLSLMFTNAVGGMTDKIVKMKEASYQAYRFVNGQVQLMPAPKRKLVNIKKAGPLLFDDVITPGFEPANSYGTTAAIIGGAVVGGSVGGFFFGTPGAYYGAKAGMSIAQNMLRSCVPDDTETFLCESAPGDAESFTMIVGETVDLPTDVTKITNAINAN